MSITMSIERTSSGREAEIPTTVPEGDSDGFQIMRPLHGRTSGPTRRSTKGQWTPEEDAILCRAVQRFKARNWKKIAECFKDRTDVQCLHRWQKVLNPELVKGPWSKEEDEMIVELVKKHGAKKWSTIAQALPGRIGKQCRERWHNHLNPGINKEAWTPEEEMALIQAHQMYGNKWAELTKFLPGRTDNMIKNHWNSSVKKKLSSYLASGLLAQFQGLRHTGNPNQGMPSSSSGTQQNSRDNSGLNDGAEIEDMSECSQASTAVGCIQTESDICNTITAHTQDRFRITGQSSSPSSCPEPYYPSLEEITCSVPDIPCRSSIKPSEEQFLQYAGNSGSTDCPFSSHELVNNSFQEQLVLFETVRHCITDAHENQETEARPIENSFGHIMDQDDKQEQASIKQDDCRVVFSEEGTGGSFSFSNMAKSSNIIDMDGCTASFNCRSDIQSSERDRSLVSQSYYPRRSSDMCGDASLNSSQPLLCSGDGKVMFGTELSATQDAEIFTGSCHDFIYPEGGCDSPCGVDTEKVCVPVKPDWVNSPKPVPVDIFCSLPLDSEGKPPCPDENATANAEEQDPGALFYEPPRFPSLELPFFSCELIPSGGDLQQAYSPLGIRQLMSSMNCSTSYSLFDSPSRDDSPDIVLKSAAKSFLCTPSILKKRQRDLLSPLHERKKEKKLERDMNQVINSEFSCLDVFDENATGKASISSMEAALVSPTSYQKQRSGAFMQDKENMDHGGNACLDVKISEEVFTTVESEDTIKEKATGVGAMEIDSDSAIQMDQQPSGVLVEHNMNDSIFFSPDRNGYPRYRAFTSGVRNLRVQHSKSLETTSNQDVSSIRVESSSANLFISPNIGERKFGRHLVSATSLQCYPLSEVTFENAGNNGDFESFSICGDTPAIKRAIESPSAWKSPWFMNTFLPGSRVDTDITIEDMGYSMSPVDGRSCDALGLMKQLSEFNAPACAWAEEVLASADRKVPRKEACHDKENISHENTQFPENDQEDHSRPPPDAISTERRVLDFSGCDTPGKAADSKKSSIATPVSFSSPSSYLMKGCR